MANNQNTQSADTYDADLHPHNRAGESSGGPQQNTRTAYDLKELHRALHDLPDNELRQIPVLEAGTRLEEGAVYLDLRRPENGEFRGMNNRVVGAEDWLVPKSQTDFELWNRLCNHISPSYRLGRLSTVHDRDISDPDA